MGLAVVDDRVRRAADPGVLPAFAVRVRGRCRSDVHAFVLACRGQR